MEASLVRKNMKSKSKRHSSGTARVDVTASHEIREQISEQGTFQESNAEIVSNILSDDSSFQLPLPSEVVVGCSDNSASDYSKSDCFNSKFSAVDPAEISKFGGSEMNNNEGANSGGVVGGQRYAVEENRMIISSSEGKIVDKTHSSSTNRGPGLALELEAEASYPSAELKCATAEGCDGLTGLAERTREHVAEQMYPRLEAVKQAEMLYPALPLPLENINFPLPEKELLAYSAHQELAIGDAYPDCFLANEKHWLDSSFHSNIFTELLETYSDSIVSLEGCRKSIASLDESVVNCLSSVWQMKTEFVKVNGQCGEGKAASASQSYTKAVFTPTIHEKLLKHQLSRRNLFCEQKSLHITNVETARLLCESFVKRLIAQYGLGEGGVDSDRNLQKSVQLEWRLDRYPGYEVAGSDFCDSLRVCFQFLRKTGIPERLKTDLVRWTQLLGKALLRIASVQDHFFFISHILRLPVIGDLVSLIQPFLGSSNVNALRNEITSHFLSVLKLLLSPIEMREEFLSEYFRISATGDRENSWTLVSPEGDEEDLFSGMQISEDDLVAVLNQFSLDQVLCLELNCVDFSNPDMVMRMISVGSRLILTLAGGLDYYAAAKYRLFCKQLCHIMRNVILFLAEYCDWAVESLRSGAAPETTERRKCEQVVARVTCEFEHMFLRYACIVASASQKTELWQFLVNVPYASLTTESLWKVVAILISPHRFGFEVLSGKEWRYEELAEEMKGGKLFEFRFLELNDAAALNIITALCEIASVSSGFSDDLAETILTNLFNICFVSDCTKDRFWKIGKDQFPMICKHHCFLMSTLLHSTDAHSEEVLELSLKVFQDLPFGLWVPNERDVGVLRKWLMFDPESTLSQIARWVVRGLSAQLIPKVLLPEVLICLVDSHARHCKYVGREKRYQNPDFNSFVWDVITSLSDVELKVPEALTSRLTSALQAGSAPCLYLCVHMQRLDLLVLCHDSLSISTIVVSCLTDRKLFSKALRFVNLILTGSSVDFTNYVDFQRAFFVSFLSQIKCKEQDRTVLIDFKGAIVRTIVRPQKNSSEVDTETLFHRWLNMLMPSPGISSDLAAVGLSAVLWTKDSEILNLLDSIVLAAMSKDVPLEPAGLVVELHLKNLVEASTSAAAKQRSSWLGWLGGSDSLDRALGSLPVLVNDNRMSQFPWISYLCLMAETRIFKNNVLELETKLLKDGAMTLDKFAEISKSGFGEPLEVLPPFRWANFAGILPPAHPLLACAVRNVLGYLIARHTDQTGNASSLGLRYMRCAKFEMRLNIIMALLENSGKAVESKIPAAVDPDKSILPDLAVKFYHAALVWVRDVAVYSPYTVLDSVECPDGLAPYLRDLWRGERRADWDMLLDKAAVRSLVGVFDQNFGKSAEPDASPSAPPEHFDKQPPLNGHPIRFVGLSSLDRLQRRLQTGHVADHVLPLPTPKHLASSVAIREFSSKHLNDERKVVAAISESLDHLTLEARAYCDFRASLTKQDMDYSELLKRLYQNVQRELVLELRCRDGLVQRCPQPKPVRRNIQECKRNSAVVDLMAQNRSETDGAMVQAVERWKSSVVRGMAELWQLCNDLVWATRSCKISQLDNSANSFYPKLFYFLVSRARNPLLEFAPTESLMSRLVEKMGRSFVAGNPSQVMPLLRSILAEPQVSGHLALLFTPCVAEPRALCEVYELILDGLKSERVSVDTGSVLLKKFNFHDKSTCIFADKTSCARLLTMVLRGLSFAGDDSKLSFALHETFLEHWLAILGKCLISQFHTTLMALLEASNCKEVSVLVWVSLIENLTTADESARWKLSADIISKLSPSLAQYFADRRSMLASVSSVGLYGHWATYASKLAELVHYVMRRRFESLDLGDVKDDSLGEQLLASFWEELVKMYQPWLMPGRSSSGGLSGLIPAWTKAEHLMATHLVEKFLENCQELCQKFNGVPTGQSCVVSLFWRFLFDQLLPPQLDFEHVVSVYRMPCLALPLADYLPDPYVWSRFLMVLKNGPSLAEPLITDIIVRLPLGVTSSIDKLTTHGQLHIVMEIMCRCASKEGNYDLCKRTFPSLLEKLISAVDWSLVGQVPETVKSLKSALPNSYGIEIPGGTVVTLLNRLLRQACMFEASDLIDRRVPLETSPGLLALSQHQAAYVESVVAVGVRLLLRDAPSHAEPVFKRLVAVVGDIDTLGRLLSPEVRHRHAALLLEPVAQLLNAFKGNVPIAKKSLALLFRWFSENPESHLKLPLLSTVSAKVTNVESVAMVVEFMVPAFYEGEHANYHTLGDLLAAFQLQPSRHVAFQECVTSTLPGSTPTGGCNFDSPALLALALYGHLRLPLCRSPADELAVLKLYLLALQTASDYSLSEPKLLIILGQILVLLFRQFQFASNSSVAALTLASGLMESLMGTLTSLSGDHRGLLNAVWSRKPTYTAKFRLICILMISYMKHQKNSSSGFVRLMGNQPMSDEVEMDQVRALLTNRVFGKFTTVINDMVQVLTDPMFHFGDAKQVLYRIASPMFSEGYVSMIS